MSLFNVDTVGKIGSENVALAVFFVMDDLSSSDARESDPHVIVDLFLYDLFGCGVQVQENILKSVVALFHTIDHDCL